MPSLHRSRASSPFLSLSAVILFPLICTLPAAATPTHRCKAVPGTAAWPSEAAWRALNESTGGRLIRPAPPGAVCHPGQAGHDSEACAAVQARWTDRSFHAANPVSTMVDSWNNDTCLPDPAYPCSGQGYPIFVVNATTAEHVQLGVKFARKHNVRLVVKNTGHDFVGRSVAPNALSIWTHHMKEIKHGGGVFRPKGCGGNVEVKGGHVTAQAGVQMGEAYGYTDWFNETVVGGAGLTVGLGGWVTGAGHGILSGRHGLGVDNVLEMEAVTPAGEIKTLNECQNTDLFWAMRGGGGSTFGVLTSVTMKTHPSPRMATVRISAMAITTSAEPLAAFLDMAAYVLSEMPRLSSAGLQGYMNMADRFPDPRPDQPAGQLVSGVQGMLAMPDGTPELAAAAWAPIEAHIGAAWPGIFAVTAATQDHPSFWEWARAIHDTSQSGGDFVLGSWLLGRDALTASRNATAEALGRFIGGEGISMLLNFVGGKGVMEAKPRGGCTGVLPAWRKAYLHPITSQGFPPLDPAAKAAAASIVRERVAALRELAPDMGAYMNEANPYEVNWQDQFWGANYARLCSIKRSVDPDDVLWCHPCVGNEGWKEVNGQLCRV